MVMRDIDSFHCPEPRFISRGAVEGNKHGRGVSRNNHTFTVLLYRYNTFMPVYLHLLSYFHHVNRRSDLTVSRLCHGSLPIFEEFLSSSRENPIYHGFEALKCFITYVYFILIMDSHVHTVSVVWSKEFCNA